MSDLDVLFESAEDQLRSPLDFVRWGASRFNEAELCFGHGSDDAVTEAMRLVLHAVHLPPGVPDELLRATLTCEEKRQILALLRRRIAERMPAAYLTGEAWFAGLAFHVDKRVLIPRSPIAELIEKGFEPWLHGIRVQRVLDLCTGSGCIAVACAMAMPEALVDAADISPEALQVAELNVRRYALEKRVRLVRSDLFESLDRVRYDLIVSNPPYVASAELERMPAEFSQEPRLGLFAGDDGLDIVRRLLRSAERHLSPDGVLIVEVGASKPALVSAYPQAPFLWLEFERGGEGVFLLTATQLRESRLL